MTDLTQRPQSNRLRGWLQAENAAITLAGLWFYAQTDLGWGFFALCLLLPDLAMLGYLRGPRPGALCYNIAHSYAGPVLLTAAAGVADWSPGTGLAMIWGIHIALDRAIGYGLKYDDAFKHTHLDAL